MTKDNRTYENMLGQDTGYKDINNKEIHCGDIIKYPRFSDSDIFYVGKVKFGEWYQDGSDNEYAPILCCGFYIERQNKKCIFPNWVDVGDIDKFYLKDYDEEQSLAMIAKDRDYGNIEIIEEFNKTHAHWEEDGIDTNGEKQMNSYLDFDLMKKYPNKYNLTPKNISTIKVLDWDRLKEHTSDYTKKYQFCSHLEGCEKEGQPFNNKNLFWIGFFVNGEVDCDFTTLFTDSCKYSSFSYRDYYNFEKFYSIKSIENPYNMQVQANAIKYLNMLIDEKIISPPNE